MTIARQLSDNWSSEDDIFCDIWAGSKERGGEKPEGGMGGTEEAGAEEQWRWRLVLMPSAKQNRAPGVVSPSPQYFCLTMV